MFYLNFYYFLLVVLEKIFIPDLTYYVCIFLYYHVKTFSFWFYGNLLVKVYQQ